MDAQTVAIAMLAYSVPYGIVMLAAMLFKYDVRVTFTKQRNQDEEDS